MYDLRLLESGPYRFRPNKRRIDQMLHQRLSEIFRERCRSDSSRIKNFFCAPDSIDLSEKNFMIDLILEQDPVLSQNIWKELLRERSLLWIAILGRYWNSAELLVRSGDDVNELYGLQVKIHGLKLNQKSTVLHALLQMDPSEENEGLIRLVTDHGADLQARDTLGRSVLHVAVKYDRVQIFDMLLERGADLQAWDSEEQTALHLAVKYDRAQLFNMLLEKGADLRIRNSKEQTALYLAVELGQVHMAQMFLEKAAVDNVNVVNDDDNEDMIPLLLAAVSSEAEELIPLLIKHGADLKVRDSNGENVLHLVAIDGPVNVAEMLLEKTALSNVSIVNDADNEGRTPLLIAASSYKAGELVPLFIKYGADVFVKDARGQNVLHWLSLKSYVEHVDLARVLIEKGISLDDREYITQYQPIHNAIKAGCHKLVKLYLDNGADVNSLVNDDDSPLHIAAKARQKSATPVVETLIKHGAEINRRTESEHFTPLHIACRWFYDTERIRLLMAAGADIFMEDRRGMTPFAHLVNQQENDPQCMRLMLKTFALKKFCQPTIEITDEKIIKHHPKLQNYYRGCIEQIERMKSTRFIETCTFFDLLMKSHCQIAALMRNPDFERKFKLYDLSTSEFATYAEDIVGAFDRAEKHYQSMLDQEDVINDAVYHILPHLIVRQVVHHIFDCCKNV